MVISTQHLLPVAVPPPLLLQEPAPSLPTSGPQTPGIGSQPAFVVSPQPAQGGPPPQLSDFTGVRKAEFVFVDPSNFGGDVADAAGPSGDDLGASGSDTKEDVPPTAVVSPAPPPFPARASTIGEGTADVPMEILDNDEAETKPQLPGTSPSEAVEQPIQGPPSHPAQIYPGGYPIDVCFEASKLPLDVAIFNSARAAGGDEKIRKYLQAVLVIGGTALVPGMAHALESRLQAIATPLVPNMEKVQIIPPPKDVDPRVLAWKGAAVLGKMDGVTDLWITAADWDILGMRGLKERCFYL